MKISIIIPVYNEAESLNACLDAIANQTIKPYEVIVVDNNSLDDTRLVAKAYDFVTLISETKQGVVHARSTGFDHAKGDIIARIDGDSILPNDWLQSVEQVFKDESVDAVSGQAIYYGVAGASIINSVDLFFRRYLSNRLKNHLYLWGANMAIRRNAWRQVRGDLCQKGGQHEDFDLAIHLQEIGGKVTFDERLVANVSSRRIDSDFLDFMHYVLISPNTYAQHGIGERRHLYPVVVVCALGYFPAHVMHKGYDSELGKFSWSRLMLEHSTIARVDPTANVV
jgi:glycosyltransferase involved in cell wall biosynthesis